MQIRVIQPPKVRPGSAQDARPERPTIVNKPYRILLVEDNAGDAGLILGNLRDNGLAVDSARVDDATTLGKVLAAQDWDILLCDYDVPGLDLAAVLALVAGHASGTPVVLVCGAVGEEAVADSMRAGVIDVVLKDRLNLRLAGIVRREVGVVRQRRTLEARRRRISAARWLFAAVQPRHDALQAALANRERATKVVAPQTQITDRERSFRLLFDSNPVPMWVYDIDTLEFLQVNDAAIARYGWSRAEFMARTVADVLPAGARQAARGTIRVLHATNATVSTTHITAMGERIAARVAVHGIRYEGRAANLTAIWDVGEVERSRDELRAKNEALAEMTQRLATRAGALADAAELARIGYWRAEFQSRRIDWSPEMFAILGVDAAAFLPSRRNIFSRVHLEDRAAFKAFHRSLKRDGIVSQAEYRIVRPSGEVRVLRELPRLLMDADGNRIGITGVIQDITGDVQARRESRRWADAVKHAGVGITIVDPASDKVLYVNPAYAAQHAMSPEQALRHKGRDAYAPHDLGRVQAMLSSAGIADHVVFEADRRRADGSVFPAMMAVTYVRPVDGSPPYRIKTILDITQRKAAEAQTLQMQRLATLGQMAAGLAHELNQPLAVMAVAAENAIALTERGGRAEAVVAKLRQVLAQSERASEIVRSVIAFGRRDAGSAVPTRIAVALDGALAIVDTRLRASGIEVHRKLAPDLPPAVMGRVQLEQVLTNLLMNATDAYAANRTARPAIWIEAWCDGAETVITVADTAGGIPATALARIFEPFFTTKSSGHGTGLGLSISFDLVAGAGGSLRAGNQDGGAVFELRLPAGTIA